MANGSKKVQKNNEKKKVAQQKAVRQAPTKTSSHGKLQHEARTGRLTAQQWQGQGQWVDNFSILKKNLFWNIFYFPTDLMPCIR